MERNQPVGNDKRMIVVRRTEKKNKSYDRGSGLEVNGRQKHVSTTRHIYYKDPFEFQEEEGPSKRKDSSI